jgi:polysaccharide biosynthesis protein PslG
VVTEVLARDGSVSQDPGLARYNVALDAYDEQLGHNIPKVFTDFFAQQGVVYEGGHYVRRTLFDWIFVLGLPISEPYWARVKVGGVEKDVLMQAFQRRVLTYTPGNVAGFEVEMGNVGQHYLRWRYGS